MLYPASSVTVDLLSAWRWLLGGRPRLHSWSAAGDLFYSDERGQVWQLDLGAGDAECVAESSAAFEQSLRDPDTADERLLLPVVREFEQVHGPLGPHRCLSFTTLPVFGGSYGIDNRYALAVVQHAAYTGDIHRQIRDLPDGTAIRLKVVP